MRSLLFAFLLSSASAFAQPCLVGYTLTQSPLPTNGTYACGETVTFCFTVTFWNSTNANWFHGISASFGPGWDVSTLTPGAPPPSCSGNGYWAWYPSVQGTAGSNIGPQGPGFFYNNTTPADGNPGNNFGDFCVGAVNWQFCWTISVLSPPACVNGLSLSASFNTFSDSETGSWGSAACNLDPIPTSNPAVILACSANAGSNGAITLCSASPPSVLFNALGGTPQANGAWTNPSGAAHSGILDPATDAAGNYTYTVTSNSPPCSQTATIAVTINPQPNAGTDGATTTCASSAAFSLLSSLGGAPMPGGTWTGPSGASSGTFNPAVDAAGIYTYTITGTPPCTDASASVTVTVNPSPFAGVGGPLILCSNSVPISLSTGLSGGYDPNGSWYDPSGAQVGGSFNPTTNAPGTYTYTVNGIAPCANSSATVTVTVNQLPNAGTNAAATLCETAGATVLTSLLGGAPGAGGTWADPSGQAIGASITPATASSGDYTYSITGAAPCPSASATLTLTIIAQPDAGSNSTVNLCTASAPVDLFSSLSGTPDAGGSWSGPSGPVGSTTFTPGTSAPGGYTYTIQAQAPCVNASATVTVNVSQQPSAGVSAPLSVCSSSGATALLPILGTTAQPGGTWTSPTGATVAGTFTPGTSADGTYTYTIAGIAPCPDASAMVTVTTIAASNPGSNGTLNACTSDAAISLINTLGGTPGAGGTWTTPGGGAMNGTLNPSSAAPGNYTYTIAANGPCPAVSAQVNVSISQAVSAGTSSSQSLCSSNAAPFNLITALGGAPTAGGTWTAPDGTAHPPTFSTTNDAPGVYTYTVNGPAPCPSASSTVTMSVVQAPSAGVGGAISICANEAVANPLSWLTGSPDVAGAWTGPNGAITQIDPSTAASGSYTYSVTGTAPCPNAQAVIALTVDQLPNAGTDGILSICINGPSTSLLPLLSGAQPSGTWSGPTGAFSGTFIPGQSPPGAYTYTVAGSGACSDETDQGTVTVTVNPLPQPSFVVDVDRGCVPLEVNFTNTTPEPLISAGWSFGDGGLASTVMSAWHMYLGAGMRNVSLTVADANGCTASITVNNAVLVSSGPTASFYAQPMRVSVNNPSTVIFQTPEPGASYHWTIDGTELDTIGDFGWTFSPPEVGYREICLVATDTLGCSNSSCLRVLIDDDLTIYVPNAFTPNSDDKNEVWRPSVLGVETGWYHLRVFDRWGLEVFSTDDPAVGWNGALNNSGELLPQDVYVWMLKAKDQFTPEKADLIGTVTLLR